VTASAEESRALIRYALAGLALTVILLWTAYLAREVLLIVYVAALVAIGLSPLVTSIARRENALTGNRIPRWLAILSIYLIIVATFVGIGMLVIPPLVSQARDLWREFPELLHKGQQFLIDRGLLTREISVREAVEKAPGSGGDAFEAVLRGLWGVVGGIFGLVTILILAFYFLLDSDLIVRTFVRVFPRPQRRRVADACRRVTTKVSAWLGGQLFLAGVIGGSAALALWLMGVPYFYVLALIAAVGELIPIVGPLLASIPAIVVASTVSWPLALGVAIFFLAQQQFENHVLVPKVMSRQVGISAAVVIVALMLGGALMGIVGAILAVPTAAVLHVFLEEIAPDVVDRE
jgi:predicted PurR-regulated permease PerM